MSITAIFISDPFKQEIRIDGKMFKMNTVKDGEICILKDFYNSIFEVKDTIINIVLDDNSNKQIKVNGTGIVKFENNVFTYFGNFEEISCS